MGDPLDGKTVASLRLGQFGFDHNSLTFAATFTDGSQGVFAASVNAVNFSGFFDPVDNPLCSIGFARGNPYRSNLASTGPMA